MAVDDDMDELIKRLEAAGGPARELDRDIALAVGYRFGPTPSKQWDEDWPDIFDPAGNEVPLLPSFTESIDAAATLVPEGYIWDVTSTGTAWADCMDGDLDQFVGSKGATPAIALCIAALRARTTTTGEGW
jgi:hypothetical protein